MPPPKQMLSHTQLVRYLQQKQATTAVRLATSSREMLPSHPCYFFLNFGVNYVYTHNKFSQKGLYCEWTRLTEKS